MPSATHNSTNKNPPYRLIFEVSYALPPLGKANVTVTFVSSHSNARAVGGVSTLSYPTVGEGFALPQAARHTPQRLPKMLAQLALPKRLDSPLLREGRALPYNVTHRPLPRLPSYVRLTKSTPQRGRGDRLRWVRRAVRANAFADSHSVF